DTLFAKQLTYALQAAGKVVFPDCRTAWHFDDKVGQKYLLESIDAPLVPSYVFYDQQKALEWVEKAKFPKVFKLRRGAGGAHVKLVENKHTAKELVFKAFKSGFSQYNKMQSLKERWYQYRYNNSDLWNVAKGLLRFAKTTEYAKVAGPERGYIYFQDFIPNNRYDLRIKVISDKCYAFSRVVRSGDFRASGSGVLDFDLKKIPLEAVKTSFHIAEELQLQSVAFDFVKHNNIPLLLEMSYSFGIDSEEFEIGYWNSDLEFIEGEFNPFGWMVEDMV